jgi:tetratricopeptide (TPR) repeat protein
MPPAAPFASGLSARRDLGIAWMNRGHGFQQAGRLAEAIAAYAAAIIQLRTLPIADHPAMANSLGAAWMNHGLLLHRAHGTARAAEALASFEAAAGVLRAFSLEGNPWPRRNLTGTLLNRANLLLDLAGLAEAAAGAREALALCLPHERLDPVDAGLGLKVRRVLCDALGQLIVSSGADQDALAAEAGDLVDDALAIIRHWHRRGETVDELLAARFFRYGTRLYRSHQPHFLAEFIQENLPLANPEFHAIALDAIDAALADRPTGETFLTIGDPVSDRRRRTWRDLAALRARLAA